MSLHLVVGDPLDLRRELQLSFVIGEVRAAP
jgi:hypothetical protein